MPLLYWKCNFYIYSPLDHDFFNVVFFASGEIDVTVTSSLESSNVAGTATVAGASLDKAC